MNKKWLSGILIAALAVSAFSACGGSASTESSSSSEPASSSSQQEESASQEESAAEASSQAEEPSALPETFVLGLDASFPPMGFMDQNNNIIGVDIDLAKAVCEKLGMEFEAKPIDWDAKEMELNSDKISCIWNGLTIQEGFDEIYEMTPAYMDNEQVIVVMESSDIQSKEDLADKIVAAQKDSSGLAALQKDEIYSSIQGGAAKEYGNYVEALTDLEIGRCDAVVMDSIVANYYINANAKAMRVLDDKMASEQYGIAFKKGNTELRDAVWGALQELEAEGKVAEISLQWFNKEDMIQIG